MRSRSGWGVSLALIAGLGCAVAAEPIALTGWQAAAGVAEVSPTAGGLAGMASDADPQLVVEGLEVDSRYYGLLELVLEVAPPQGQLELFWRGADQSWAKDRSTSVPVREAVDGATFHVNLFRWELHYRDTIAGVRLDPTDQAGARFHLVSARLFAPRDMTAEELAPYDPVELWPAIPIFRPEMNAPLGFRCPPRFFPQGVPEPVRVEVEMVRKLGHPRTVGTYSIPGWELTAPKGHVFDPRVKLSKWGQYFVNAKFLNGPLEGHRVSTSFLVKPESEILYFAAPWKYSKDFSLVKARDGYHLFAITGAAGPEQSWERAGNEEHFLHAVSANLRGWKPLPEVVPIRDSTFESHKVWAPHVFRHDETWYMAYTGVNEAVAQHICLATSSGLAQWNRVSNNPIWTPANCAWADWAPDRWGDCRDPMVLEDEGCFILYYVAKRKAAEPVGVVAAATSTDLLHWHDAGPVLETNYIPESPFVVRRGERYTLFINAGGRGAYQSASPLGPFQRIEADLPGDIMAYEVAVAGDLEILAGFSWQPYGNLIKFYRLVWTDDGRPGYAPLPVQDVPK